jgi:hypothetical protein
VAQSFLYRLPGDAVFVVEGGAKDKVSLVSHKLAMEVRNVFVH